MGKNGVVATARGSCFRIHPTKPFCDRGAAIDNLNYRDAIVGDAETLSYSDYSPPTASKKRVPVRNLLVITGALLLGLAAGAALTRRTADAPVFSVNGVAIHRDNFFHRCELAAGPAVAQQMLKEELQLQFAAKQGVLPTEAEVDAKLKTLNSEPEYLKSLSASHKTVEDARRGVLLDLAQNAIVTKGITVNNSEIEAFYRSNTDPKNPRALYYQPEAVQIAVIVCAGRNDSNAAVEALAAGNSFADVVRKFSRDASKSNNGLLPAIRRGALDPAKFPGLEKTLFSMQPGGQLNNVKIGNMFWIIRCVGRQSEMTVDFEKVKEKCAEQARLAKGLQTNGQALHADSAAFEKSAEIRVFDNNYKEATTLSR